MRDKTKRDNLILVLGWALFGDSIFVFIMFILASINGTFQKKPETLAVQTVLMICFGGITMLFMGYHYIIKEYQKPMEPLS